jgi:hypothetical protein
MERFDMQKSLMPLSVVIALAGASAAYAVQMNSSPEFSAGLQLTQATPPASDAAQETALEKAGSQTTGTIKEIDVGARQLMLDDGQTFTLDEAIDLAELNLEAGQNVLVSFEEDTRTASHVQPAEALPEELPADPPAEGASDSPSN